MRLLLYSFVIIFAIFVFGWNWSEYYGFEWLFFTLFLSPPLFSSCLSISFPLLFISLCFGFIVSKCAIFFVYYTVFMRSTNWNNNFGQVSQCLSAEHNVRTSLQSRNVTLYQGFISYHQKICSTKSNDYDSFYLLFKDYKVIQAIYWNYNLNLVPVVAEHTALAIE